ncbi:hypothetical protein EON63_08940 [archaeon]|nr:MAG: hypothetical protein EON63_08940 [archaeon]
MRIRINTHTHPYTHFYYRTHTHTQVGGVLAAVPSHPFDVIKTCMQGDLEKIHYKGFRHTLGALLKEEVSVGMG